MYKRQPDKLPNNSVSTFKTQKDIASEMGISVDTLQNYKKLTEMVPELSDLVDTGIVSNTTALAVVKQLSPEEQEQLVSSLDVTKRLISVSVVMWAASLRRLV